MNVQFHCPKQNGRVGMRESHLNLSESPAIGGFIKPYISIYSYVKPLTHWNCVDHRA